jgi:hypothetical protein
MLDENQDRPGIDEDHIRSEVRRLSRPHPSGGRVVERAAILAAGADSAAMMRWLADQGEPEALPALAAAQGLHGDRAQGAGDVRRPLRYVVASDRLEPPAA